MILGALPDRVESVGAAFDEARWAALVREHGPFLRRSIARLSGVGPHVDDIVQEAFVTAFRKQRALPSGNMLRAWLFRAAKNHLQHQRRTIARELRKRDAIAVIDTSQAPVERNEDRERAAHLTRAVLALPLEMREAFVLVQLEGLTAVEAAVVAGVVENTLRTRLRRGRERVFAEMRRVHAAE